MDKNTLLEFQANIFAKMEEHALRIENKISNESLAMTKEITNLKETLSKQEDNITNIQKEIETIPEIVKRLETLEKMQRRKLMHQLYWRKGKMTAMKKVIRRKRNISLKTNKQS